MKGSFTNIQRDICLDLNLHSVTMQFDDPVPSTILIQWARGNQPWISEFICRRKKDLDKGDCRGQCSDITQPESHPRY